MAIQNDNTLVTKGDLKKIYQENIAPNLGGGINYYYTDRTGEELKSCYASLGSAWPATANTNVPFIKRMGEFIQPSTGLFTIPNGTKIEVVYTFGGNPGGDSTFGLYNNTDSLWITADGADLKMIDPFIQSGYNYGSVFQVIWKNETGHDVDVAIRCNGTAQSTTLAVDRNALTIKEIGRIVDPVKYVSNNSDLQETPVGNIISYMGNSVPKHYLTCDGATYAIGTYPELETFIIDEFGTINYFGGDGTTTWAVPDLQGEFLRGTGSNSHTNQGSGADVGTHQDGSTVTNPFTNAGDNICLPYNGWTQGNADSTVKTSVGYTNAKNVTKTATTTYPALKTVRPTNTSVKYCIKYESTYHAFFSNASYKVSVPFTIVAHTTGWEDAVLNSSLAIGDTSLISGNYFIAPMDGWYAIGCSSIQNGAVNQFFGFAIDNVYKSGRIGYGSTEIFYLTKGQTIKYASYAGGSAASASAQNGYVNFCLLESNYNPTIVSADSVYSENEQMIGYWSNGKPLYQKTVDCGALPSSASVKETSHNISNVDNIIDITGTATDTTNGTTLQLSDISVVNLAHGARVYATLTKVCLQVAQDLSFYNKVYVTLKYTKTTDTASALQVENSLLLNRPDLWEIGTEYHFGGGLYGQRFTGNLSTTTTTAWATVDSSSHWKNTTFKIFGIGGTIIRAGSGNAHAPFPYNDGTGLYQPFFGDSNGSKFMIQHKDSSASTNSYDIWVTYTK